MHLPGEEGIIEDCVLVFAIAHTYYVSAVSRNSFMKFPYMRHITEANANRILIERLLGLAAKVRFLDDQTGVIKKFDRRLRAIGSHHIDDNLVPDVGIRTALNKLLHHRTISVRVSDLSCIVVGIGDESKELTIPEGSYIDRHVIIEIGGEYRNQFWRFDLDLFILLNEIQRLFHLRQSSSG